MNFYATEDVCKRIIELKKETNTPDSDVTVNLVKAYKTYNIGDYKVTPLPAVHSGYNIETGTYYGFTPVTYIIEKDGKSMLYHHDSDKYVKETFEFLKSRNKPFDLVSFDCTNGLNPHTYIGHLGYEECLQYKKEFIENGLATTETKFVVNHFSHNGKYSVYDDMVTIAEKDGIIVSYDGLEVEF